MSDQKETKALVQTTPGPLVHPASIITGDITVLASNPAEMEVAQKNLIDWMELKIRDQQMEVDDIRHNLSIAKKRKWRTRPWEGRLRKAEKKVEFYEKAKAALEAGYCLVPNFPVDVVAIRTTQKKPSKNLTRYGNPVSQETNSPPKGKGRYVDPQAFTKTVTRWHHKDQKMVDYTVASEYDDVDFPIAYAKPQTLDATGKAMAQKVFDEIGVLPSRRRKGDPLVVGIIKRKEGYTETALTFLISWFIDTRQL